MSSRFLFDMISAHAARHIWSNKGKCHQKDLLHSSSESLEAFVVVTGLVHNFSVHTGTLHPSKRELYSGEQRVCCNWKKSSEIQLLEAPIHSPEIILTIRDDSAAGLDFLDDNSLPISKGLSAIVDEVYFGMTSCGLLKPRGRQLRSRYGRRGHSRPS